MLKDAQFIITRSHIYLSEFSISFGEKTQVLVGHLPPPPHVDAYDYEFFARLG